MAGVPVARMTSTGMRTSSVAIEGNRSGCPSADRYSRTNCRCSTYPSSSRPRRNAASCAAFELAARASMMPMRYRRDSGCAAPVARAVVARAAANPPPTHPRNVLRVNMSSARWRQDATDRRRSSIGAMLLRSSFDHGCVGKLAHETFEAPKAIARDVPLAARQRVQFMAAQVASIDCARGRRSAKVRSRALTDSLRSR